MPRAQQHSSAAYRYDETMKPDGSLLPGWQSILAYIEGLSPEQRNRRERDIVRQMRANGLAYHPENKNADHGRPWSLDLIPMLFDNPTWDTLTRGLDQRARLKQALYRDIYGQQRILKEGVVPAAMLYSHHLYLRDLVSTEHSEPNTDVLPIVSCDLNRSETGEWLVVDDFCQYPTGIGYSLENRIVLARVLPRTFEEHRVRRIVRFFRHLQRYIQDTATKSVRCVLLSYPPSHPHYFEFAWLAKYLGYPLIEPADLTVRDNHVFIKTITGLQPVDIILRLINDRELDPLIVGNNSNLGIPGIVEAARRGGVSILNPMGAGVLENPAFNSLLEPLCSMLLGEPLLLKSPATYWLGDQEQRTFVQSTTGNFIFRHINNTERQFNPAQMNEQQFMQLQTDINQSPASYVAEERITPSVAPALHDAEIVQKQITVRTYLVTNRDDGYKTMPGGLCLLDAQQNESTGQSPDSQISSKDVWVLSNEVIPEDTLLKTTIDESSFAYVDGELPSRIAESVFWLGRNAERVESLLRLLRSILQHLLDDDTSHYDSLASTSMHCLLRSVTAATGTTPGFIGRGAKKRTAHPDTELISLLQDTSRVGTLSNSLQQWQLSASAVSDRLSADQLRVFNRLSELQTTLGSLTLLSDFCSDKSVLAQVIDVLDELLLVTAASTGLEHENVTHSDIWLFIMLGRRIERAHQITVVVRSAMSVDRQNPRVLESLLRLFDSVMTYRSRYRSGLDNRLVLQLLLLDEINPRSLAYQFKCIQDLIDTLPGRRVGHHIDPISRLAVAGLSRVRLANPETLMNEDRDARQNLHRFLKVLQQLPASMADAVTAHYFTHAEPRHELGSLQAPPSGMLTAVESIPNGADT